VVFAAILQSVGALTPGQRLHLLATFRPEPLFAVMAGRGFGHAAQTLPGGDWEVLFTPKTAAPDATSHATTSALSAPNVFGEAPAQSLDHRGLAPPEPMLRTLQALEQMAAGAILEVLVDRDPLILYSELKARGHAFQADKQADGSFRVLIQRGG
jgi:uncharacterized protein (DUF2249 family)